MTQRLVQRSAQLLGIALAVVAVAAASTQIVVNEGNALSFYRDFTRLTRQPHLVSPVTAALCTIPSAAATEGEKQRLGPHYQARVHVYANPVAMPAVTSHLTAFPIGSVIVKEKLMDDGKVSGVGGMIKREAGYSPKDGDWEYFYYGEPREFASGRIDGCIGCHRLAKTTDFVYSVWSLNE